MARHLDAELIPVTESAQSRGAQPMRLDPGTLPARFTLPAGRPASGRTDAAVCLDGRTVTVRRQLSGLPLTLSVPISLYRGVAVRIEPGSDAPHATIELLHADPALTLPLASGGTMDDIAADWQAWARCLGLPMLLALPDGTLRPVGGSAEVAIGTAMPRRARGFLATRRPRFLMRRRPGAHGAMPVYREREIIAPE